MTADSSCALCQLAIERIEEDVAVVLVVLPAVLAVQDDADQVRRGRVVEPPPDLQQTVDHVFGGLRAGQVLVEEADAVRQLVIAEDDVWSELAVRQDAVGLVQRAGIDDQVTARHGRGRDPGCAQE